MFFRVVVQEAEFLPKVFLSYFFDSNLDFFDVVSLIWMQHPLCLLVLMTSSVTSWTVEYSCWMAIRNRWHNMEIVGILRNEYGIQVTVIVSELRNEYRWVAGKQIIPDTQFSLQLLTFNILLEFLPFFRVPLGQVQIHWSDDTLSSSHIFNMAPEGDIVRFCCSCHCISHLLCNYIQPLR